MAVPVERRLFLRVLSDPGNAASLRARTETFLEGTDLDLEDREALVLAVNEAFANTVSHAYEGRHDGVVEVRMEDLPDRIEIRLRDFGAQTPPELLKSRDLDDVRPGGLGIHFMESACDQVDFDTTGSEGTEVILTKKKTETGGPPASVEGR